MKGIEEDIARVGNTKIEEDTGRHGKTLLQFEPKNEQIVGEALGRLAVSSACISGQNGRKHRKTWICQHGRFEVRVPFDRRGSCSQSRMARIPTSLKHRQQPPAH